jgi:hypothetical protein
MTTTVANGTIDQQRGRPNLKTLRIQKMYLVVCPHERFTSEFPIWALSHTRCTSSEIFSSYRVEWNQSQIP